MEKELREMRALAIRNAFMANLDLLSEDYSLTKLSDCILAFAGFDPTEENKEEIPVYVLSSKSMSSGCLQAFNYKAMEEASKLLGNMIYIIPSSIHEVLLTKYDKSLEEPLLRCIEYVNGTQFEGHEYEILSNDLYIYDHHMRKYDIVRRKEVANE